MIQVKQSNVKFKYNDSGNIKYSPLLDLLIVDHQSEYIDQARNRIQGIVNQINNNSSTINNLCKGYRSENNYNIGDYVFYNGELYYCTETIQNSEETFPENSFKKCTVGDQLLKIKNIQLDRIKKILQCEDSEEIVLDLEEDFVPNSYIKASSGNEISNSAYYSTNFINIKNSLKLSYTRGVSISDSPTVGMAFYDSNKIFIPESGQTILPLGSSVTQEQIFVPINACYVRFSNDNRSVREDEFKVIKINKIADRINNVNDRIDNLSNNLSETYSSNKSYQVGDYCIKNDRIYQCFLSVDQSQNEDWETIKNKFRQIKISEQLQKAKSFKIKLSGWQSGGYGVESDEALKRINKGRPSPSSHFLMIACKQGDIFLIKKATSISSTTRGYIFATKDDTYYYTYPNNLDWCAPVGPLEFTNKIVIAPKNAEYLFIHYNNTEVGDWISKDKYATYYINPLTFQIIKILDSISSQYNEQETYNVDDYCLYNDKLYRCKNEVANSTWDENDWQEANLVDYIDSLKNRINSLNANEISYDPFNLNYESGTVGHKLTETINTVSNISNNIYNITENLDNDNNRLSSLQQNKFDNPTNNDSGIVNQVLIKTENGSAWSNNLQLVNETINGLESNKINKPGSNVSNGSILMKTQNGIEWEPMSDSLNITTTIEDWLEDNISAPQNVVIDNTLTISNAVAEAQATGNLIIAGTQQPTQGSNKIWINQGNNVEEIQISTYEDLTNIVANQYSNKAYKNGEYFINEGILYRVTADITAVDNVNVNAVSKTQINIGEDLSKALWHEVQNLTAAQQSAARNNIKAADEVTVAFHTTQIDNLQFGKQDKLTFDTAPTAGSSNPVTSAGIKTVTDALAGDVDDLKSAISNSDLVLVGRENLVSGISWEQGKLINTDGTIGTNVAYKITPNIPVVGGSEYSIIYTQANGYTRICGYDSNDNPVLPLLLNAAAAVTKRRISVTMPTTATYIRCSVQPNSEIVGICAGESVDDMIDALDGKIASVQSELSDVNDYTYTSTKRMPLQWVKGGIMAATGEVNTSSNLASSPIITNGNYVTISENWKAAIGFYNNGAYVGKLNPNGGIDKVGGSWGYLTGSNNISNLLTLANANGYRVCLMPPTGITIANDSEAQGYGDSKCVIQTQDIYQIADALQKENDLLKTVLFNESKGQYCIMQYNIGNWYNGTGYLVPAEKYERFYNLQKSIIGRYQPDVLCMEEFRDQFTSGVSANVLLDTMYTQLVYARANNSYDGKGIASNREILDAENVAFTDTESGGVQRNYEKCYMYLNGRHVAIIAAHLGGSNISESNIDELIEAVEDDEYFIICADLNVNGNSPLMDKFTAKGYHIANTGNIETTTDQSYLYIDNVITSANIEIVSAFADYQKEGLEEGSDHYPLLAYVTIK